MDTNIIDFETRRSASAEQAALDRLQEVLELEHEVAELRHTISFLAVELARYRQRYG